MNRTAIDWLTEAVLQAEAREPIGPAALTLLLRRYAATGLDDIRDALGRGLARGLDAIESPDLRGPAYDTKDVGPSFPPPLAGHRASSGGPDEAQRAKAGSSGYNDLADWLTLFAEASSVSEDERMREAVSTLATRLRRAWPARGLVAPAMRSAGACLTAVQALEHSKDAHDLMAAAVDEMERIIGRVYRPGEPIARSLQQPDEADGEFSDHVDAASTLLTAHEITGRLPYSMLAEELMQSALRTSGTEDFFARCETARVFGRLAALHDDADYRKAAVIAGRADYRSDAERILESLSSSYRAFGAAAAIYGVALDEYFTRSS
jgi:hypothetical protein